MKSETHTTKAGTIWCNMIWCIWCNMIWCIWCNIIWCNMIGTNYISRLFPLISEHPAYRNMVLMTCLYWSLLTVAALLEDIINFQFNQKYFFWLQVSHTERSARRTCFKNRPRCANVKLVFKKMDGCKKLHIWSPNARGCFV